MATTIPIPVTVTQQGTRIDIQIPPVTKVVNNSGQQFQLEWNLQGTSGWSFPAEDFQSWKSGSGQPAVSRSSGSQLTSAAYNADPSVRRVWPYGVAVTNGTMTINVDPEVDNQPPTPGMGEERP